MVWKEWNDWQEDYGEGLGNVSKGVKRFTDTVTSKAGEMICNLHNKHPDKWFVPPATRGFLNAVCGGAGLPTPELSRFGGGQCPENYYIIGKWEVTRRFRSGTFPVEETLIGSPGIQGAITDIALDAVDGQKVLDFQIFTSSSASPILVRIDQGSGTGYVANTVRYEFVRADGQPDVCENSSGYPDSGDVSITNISNTVAVDITNNNGDVISTQDIDIDVDFDGNNFSFPTTVNIGGISVDVDFNGFNPSGGSDIGGGDDGGSGGGSNTTKYKEPFKPEEFKRIFKHFPPPVNEEEEEEEVEEEEIENDEIVWVLVTITTFPHDGKVILQNNPVNNDYFAGYFHWTITIPGGTYQLPAIQIRKEKNAFKAPSDALGYTLYTVNKAKVSTKLYKQIIEEET